MMKRTMVKRLISLLCAVCIVIGLFTCVPDMSVEAEAAGSSYVTKTAYTGPYSDTDGTYGATDDLGRVLTKDNETHETRFDRYVGIWYFLWKGEHGTGGPYNNTEIVKNNPFAILSEEAWMQSGGGNAGEHHFWGEPIFGYYQDHDTWVMRKQLQMFIAADLDFICIDATNGFTYDSNVEALISVWYEYLEKGYDVPKIMYYTNTMSGATMDHIYTYIYNNAELQAKYPRLSELWFYWEGKPLIAGVKAEASDTVKNYFRLKDSQWPNASKLDDGLPWMEFDRYNTPDAVYTYNGLSSMCVTAAQHNATSRLSAVAWYGSNDRSRSYVNGANSTYSKASYYGHNFGSQWRFAIENDPDLVFVTGWNEWVAQRQNESTTGYSIPGEPIWFVDAADINASRDIEPMRGYYGDNYYMQFVDYVRQYKGTAPRVNTGDNVTIDMNGDMSQWESKDITAKYTDFENDTVDRNCAGFGAEYYTDTTGRNDIVSTKVTKDAENVYFYVQTADTLTSYTDNNWMTLFIKNNDSTASNWYGYQYAVNVETPESETVAYLSKSEGDSGEWTTVSKVTMKIDDNKLMIAVPREAIEMTDDLFDIEFKWADNYTDKDFWSFYDKGDSAPYGRLNYVYSNCVTAYNGNIQYTSDNFTYQMKSIRTNGTNIHFAGWAVNNLHHSANVEIHAYVGGTAGAPGAFGYNLGQTNILNNEINKALETSGTHSFNFSLNHFATGTQTLAIYAVLEDTNVLMWQGTVNLTNENSAPVGWVDELTTSDANTILVKGWAYDPDERSTSVSIRAEVNGVSYDLGKTDMFREDVNLIELVNGNHGFEKTFTTDFIGEYTVKIYAVDSGADGEYLIASKVLDIRGKCDYYLDEDTLFATKDYGFWEMLSSPGTPEKPGYKFTGWTYSHGGTLMPDKNITAIANWEKILGDVNNDSKINVSDVTDVQKYLACLNTLTDEQLKAADVDGSGVVSIYDATCIQLLLAKEITSFDEIKRN